MPLLLCVYKDKSFFSNRQQMYMKFNIVMFGLQIKISNCIFT